MCVFSSSKPWQTAAQHCCPSPLTDACFKNRRTKAAYLWHAGRRWPVRATATAAVRGRWAAQLERQQGPSGSAVAMTAAQGQENNGSGGMHQYRTKCCVKNLVSAWSPVTGTCGKRAGRQGERERERERARARARASEREILRKRQSRGCSGAPRTREWSQRRGGQQGALAAGVQNVPTF